jgi:hypothetical protein
MILGVGMWDLFWLRFKTGRVSLLIVGKVSVFHNLVSPEVDISTSDHPWAFLT